MLIVYEGRDEVFVTTRKREKAFLQDWFAPGVGRDLEDYNRLEVPKSREAVRIAAVLRADT